MEDDFLKEAEDDLHTVDFIRAYLPQEVKDKFTDDDLFFDGRQQRRRGAAFHAQRGQNTAPARAAGEPDF